MDSKTIYSLIETVKAGDKAKKQLEEFIEGRAEQVYLAHGCFDRFGFLDFNLFDDEIQIVVNTGCDTDSLKMTIDKFLNEDLTEKLAAKQKKEKERQEKATLAAEERERRILAKLKAKYEGA